MPPVTRNLRLEPVGVTWVDRENRSGSRVKPSDRQAGWRVFEEARKRGAYLRPLGDVVYVAPPINIDDRDLEELLAIVSDSVRAAG